MFKTGIIGTLIIKKYEELQFIQIKLEKVEGYNE
jgi:hypothetical protein